MAGQTTEERNMPTDRQSLMQRMMAQRAVEDAMFRLGGPIARETREAQGLGLEGGDASSARMFRPNWRPMDPTPPIGSVKGLRTNPTMTIHAQTQAQSSRVQELDSEDDDEGDDLWETDEDEDEDEDDDEDDEDDEDNDDDMMMMMDDTANVFPGRAITRNDPRTMPCFAFSKGHCSQGDPTPLGSVFSLIYTLY